MISAQDLIEKILSRSTTDDCIVVVKDKTQANLRWASSTLTTNGGYPRKKCHRYRLYLDGWVYGIRWSFSNQCFRV